MHRIIFGFLFLFFYGFCLAQSPNKSSFAIDAPENTLFLKNTSLLLLEDYQNNFTIHDIVKSEDQFRIFNPRVDILQPYKVLLG